MAVDHYENFPVASLLAPKRMRPAIRAIYQFARTADDLADEGQATAEQRLVALAELSDQLSLIEAAQPSPWPALADAVAVHRLSIHLLRDLLSAFIQDVHTHRYESLSPLLDYCHRSADPVGRLLLQLYGVDDQDCIAWSDAICTGLQLTNFWQDIALDWQKERVYIPLDTLALHGLTIDDIANRRVDKRWTALMAGLTSDARNRLNYGKRLPRAIGGRAGFELRLVVQGGLRILERIDRARGDVFNHRPVLRSRDWVTMVIRAARMRP